MSKRNEIKGKILDIFKDYRVKPSFNLWERLNDEIFLTPDYSELPDIQKAYLNGYAFGAFDLHNEIYVWDVMEKQNK